jgi:hypothetical protein
MIRMSVAMAGQLMKTALVAGSNAAAGAVAGTMVVAEKAVQVTTKVAGTAIDTAGVLGTGTLEAAGAIGKTALDVTKKTAETTGKIANVGLDVASKTAETTGKVASVGLDVTAKAAETTGKVATTALDVTEKTAKAAADITNAATKASADIATGALDATSKIATAATSTAANIGVGTLDATGKVVTTTTKQVGDSLSAGINLAGNTTQNILNGIDGIRGILAKKAANQAAQTNQKLDARAKAIAAAESTTLKNELLTAFADLKKLTDATVGTLDGVQKTALIGKMNIYKKVVCNMLSRFIGTCKPSQSQADLLRAAGFRSTFLRTTNTAAQKAKTGVLSSVPYEEIVATYEQTIAGAIAKFTQEYEALHARYDTLINEALDRKAAGPGGRRKTVRKKKRVSRASRKRPSVRGRFA